MKLKIAAFITIAVVVITALWLNQRVDFKLGGKSVSLSADKNPEKDTVTVKKIQQSKVDLENREGQNVHVEDVSENSDIKVK